jgi:DoxX-like family
MDRFRPDRPHLPRIWCDETDATKRKMAAQMKWVKDSSQSTIQGRVLEVLGAIGLILTMIGGAMVHIHRKKPIVPNIVLGLLSAISLYATLQVQSLTILARAQKENPMTQTTANKNNGLNIALWIVQVLLFAAFIISGFMILISPIAQLSSTLPWTLDVPEILVRFIGLAEAAGALGLLLPSITKIQPQLTPLAAMCLVVVMVLAVVFHIARGEISMILPSLIFGVLNAFVAWGRRRVPILARD